MQANLPKLNISKLPAHIAIIMDGNGRWAKAKNLPRISGHKEGVKSVETAIKTCRKLGIKVLTLYAFSAENWTRPKTEINFLMRLFAKVLKEKHKLLSENGVKLLVSGSKDKVSKKLLVQIETSTNKLSKNKDMVLNLAFNYGSRQEIINAVNHILKTGETSVTEEMFKSYLYTKDLPDPDLIIRTSGEKRLSNFLLWQAAYSEFYFTEVLWPDFKERDLYLAVADFQKRKRRFGNV
ncbi:MAG TPA: isoprenyl transferase [Elusimicrobiales bacterium]|nr:isoprenyl transferase [Elusimicrobiales bacterium]